MEYSGGEEEEGGKDGCCNVHHLEPGGIFPSPLSPDKSDIKTQLPSVV